MARYVVRSDKAFLCELAGLMFSSDIEDAVPMTLKEAAAIVDEMEGRGLAAQCVLIAAIPVTVRRISPIVTSAAELTPILDEIARQKGAAAEALLARQAGRRGAFLKRCNDVLLRLFRK
ncbi:MAG: hypothetical protein AzoDbin1_03888 [Azoarcus sp.]|nr:hypothetical protein [Azoarcus sp.]